MTNLVEFLLLRIEEDEQRVRWGEPYRRIHDPDAWDKYEYEWHERHRMAWHTMQCGYRVCEMGDECECGVPARVLAECAAKRRIIEEIQLADSRSDAVDTIEISSWVVDALLKTLAQPYSSHPDFDADWGLGD